MGFDEFGLSLPREKRNGVRRVKNGDEDKSHLLEFTLEEESEEPEEVHEDTLVSHIVLVECTEL